MNLVATPATSRTIHLLRHGDTRRDRVKRYIGQADLPLNEAGRAQAEFWRGQLAGRQFERILCSDLVRSYETASIIAREHPAPVQALPRFREIALGAWDGLAVDEVRELYPGEYEKRGSDLVYYRPPAGECFADVAARVIPLFEEIVRTSQGDLLVVGHAGVNRVLLCHLLGMPLANLFRLGQDYACLNLIEHRAGGASVLGMNIAPHAFQLAEASR
jgi:probable phosphoglycerate mutase